MHIPCIPMLRLVFGGRTARKNKALGSPGLAPKGSLQCAVSSPSCFQRQCGAYLEESDTVAKVR